LGVNQEEEKKMQNRTIKKSLAMAAGTAALSLFASHANAALTITLSEAGYAPFTVTDTGNTGETETGYISYGTFRGNIDVATSNKLASPTPSEAILQLTGLLTSNTAGGTLTITTSDTGFAFPGLTGSTEYMDSVGSGTLAPSVAGDLVTFQSTATAISGVASSNVSAGLQTYLSPGIASGTVSFRDPTDVNTTFTRGSSFDLTNAFTVTLGAANEQVNLSGTTTVSLIPTPEPVSSTGLIVAVSGLLMRRRRTV